MRPQPLGFGVTGGTSGFLLLQAQVAGAALPPTVVALEVQGLLCAWGCRDILHQRALGGGVLHTQALRRRGQKPQVSPCSLLRCCPGLGEESRCGSGNAAGSWVGAKRAGRCCFEKGEHELLNLFAHSLIADTGFSFTSLHVLSFKTFLVFQDKL